ncbi:hypothetical protein GN244_ATG17028 [Phytophthora infestans]|uniref:Uncharacterized protein n=1 Tax=Phytophthora infestans TaxID=4787 RepID=A0A833ST55_PHYIN|nr:hypothetical protein GN244_ATG17028 [Phytophthora infestans]
METPLVIWIIPPRSLTTFCLSRFIAVLERILYHSSLAKEVAAKIGILYYPLYGTPSRTDVI